jgi:hypothetical protein
MHWQPLLLECLWFLFFWLPSDSADGVPSSCQCRFCVRSTSHFSLIGHPSLPCVLCSILAQADYRQGGGGGGGASGARDAALGPLAATGPHASASASGRVHRLRTIRASELSLTGGALVGEGSFGKVQVGVWNGTDVAIKANGVDCRDPTAIDREREMCQCEVKNLLFACVCVCPHREVCVWVFRVSVSLPTCSHAVVRCVVARLPPRVVWRCRCFCLQKCVRGDAFWGVAPAM